MPKLFLNTANKIKSYSIEEHEDLNVIYQSLIDSTSLSELTFLQGKDYDVVKEKVNDLKLQLTIFQSIEKRVAAIDSEVTSIFINYLNGEIEANTDKISELQKKITLLQNRISYLRSLERDIYDHNGRRIGRIDYSYQINMLQKEINEMKKVIEWLKRLYEIDNMSSTKYFDVINEIKKLQSEISSIGISGNPLPNSEELLMKMLQKTDLIDTDAPLSVQTEQKNMVLNWSDRIEEIKELAENRSSDDYINAIYSLKGLQMEMLNSGILPEELATDQVLLLEKLVLASGIVRVQTSNLEYNELLSAKKDGVFLDPNDGIEISTLYETDIDKIKYMANYINYMPYQDADGKWIVFGKKYTDKTSAVDKWCAAGMSHAMVSSGVGSAEFNHLKENYGNNYNYTENWKSAFEDLGSYHSKQSEDGVYYIPKIGDTVFTLFPNRDGSYPPGRTVNHVGIVSALSIRDGEVYVQVLEANRSDDNPLNKTAIWNVFEYSLDHDKIVGYGTLSNFAENSSDLTGNIEIDTIA